MGKYMCDRCNKKCDAKRSQAFRKVPDVLTLALNRFVFNLHTLQGEKCNDKFQFPLIVDFEPFLDEKLRAQQTKRTQQDEERLKEAYDVYKEEQKQKEEAKKKREKEKADRERREKERKEREKKEREERAKRRKSGQNDEKEESFLDAIVQV